MSAMRISSFLPFLLACCVTAGTGEQKAPNVRPAAVAGQFYPADAGRLKLALQSFLEDALPDPVDSAVALVVPHASYLYSGQIAADAFRKVKGREYDVIVILGTNHTNAGFDRITVYPRGAYRTPLGDVPVDEAIAGALLAEDRDCQAIPEAQASEHSVEVQVPFVQTLFPAARIVPVVVGTPDPAMCARFGRALAKVLKDKRALIVASSDLSHYPAYEDARSVDRQTLEAIAKLDPAQLTERVNSLMERGIRNLDTAACGTAPILAAMTAARALGATHGIVVSYANSGDALAQDRSRVVGYGSVVLAAGAGAPDIKSLSPPPSPPPATPLRAEDKRLLLKMARQSLQRYLSTETIPLARNLPPRMQVPQGAFVTLKQRGNLRGCIGLLAGDFPLGLTTAWMAVQAGEFDSRFSPVSLRELPGLEIEISVMTPMKPIARPADIVIGRDGVVIQKNGRSAVFLPQVATEQGWGLSEMLDNLCLKAGLPSGSWKSGAQFRVFQAEVFSESQF